MRPEALGPSTHCTLRAEYAYQSYSGGLQNSPYSFSRGAVRVSVSWLPHASTLR
jgi:hypothetical protein